MKRTGSWVMVLAGSLFFISGAAALVLESLWVRLFALSFGTTGLAMSTVLTAYMAGLAIGGALGGRLSDRLRTPKRLFLAYGAMEALIALFAVAMPSLRELAASADGLFESWFSGELLWMSIGRFFVSALVLVGPTILMGATLPVLSRAVVGGSRKNGRLARQAGLLYGINTFGAVAGAAVTPFFLLPLLGVTGTCWAVAFADLTVAIIACSSAVYSRDWREKQEEERGSSPDTRETSKRRGSSPDTREASEQHTIVTSSVALLGVLISGAVAMVYQQVWARFLSMIIGSSVYAVSLIFALFLLGLSLGSALYSRRTALRPGQASNLAVMHLAIATWTLVLLVFGDRLPAAFVVGIGITGVSMAKVLSLQALLASAVVLVPTFFMGMTFPATLRMVELGRPEFGVGRAVGRTYSANTLGAIAGSFFGGFVILPALGAQGTFVLCGVLSLFLCLGYSGLTWVVSGRRRALVPLASALALGAAIPLTFRPWNLSVLSSGVFRVSRSAELAESLSTAPVPAEEREGRLHDTSALEPWMQESLESLQPSHLWHNGYGLEPSPPEMIFHRAGLTATVAVTEARVRSWLEGHDWVTYSLRVNGKADASLTIIDGLPPSHVAAISPQGDAETQILSGLLPFLLHQGRPQSMLVVGWGSGLTVGAALSTGLERVRVVEIEEEVIRGSAPFQPYAGWPLRSPSLDVVEDDGRRLLTARDEQYDIIVSEPSNPWISGCSNLFTSEFFSLVASRLHEGGRFLQWVQAYEISPSTLVAILAAVKQAFPSVVIFQPAHSPSDLLIVAGRDDVVVSWDEVEERMGPAGVNLWLSRFGILGPEDIAARLVFDSDTVDGLTEGVVANSDDNLLVELAAPFDLVRYRDTNVRGILERFGASVEPPPEAMRDLPHDWVDRLGEALQRAGRRDETLRTHVDVESLEMFPSPTPVQTGILEGEVLDLGDLGDLAATMNVSEERDLGLAVLAVGAHRAREYDLAGMFLTSHCTSSASPQPWALDLLAFYCWEVGLPAKAWAFTQMMNEPERANENNMPGYEDD